jgi:hypothetical protein
MLLGNTPRQDAGLFGLKYSNRDFTQKEAWGKNCFNSSFPASLCSYLYSQNIENIYIKLNSNLKVEHSSISTETFYGISPNSDNLFYAFETQFTPYQQYSIGTLPRVDLITQAKDLGTCLQAIEIKLTALPDNTTCDLTEDNYGLTASILNASYCGVPQARKRYFLIGQLDGKDDALSYFLIKNQSKKSMTVFEYLGDSLGIKYFYRHPRSYKRRAIFSIYEPSPTIRGVNRPIPKTYKKHEGDVCDLNDNLRPLTTIERSYIQTFPTTFQFKGNKSDLEQMIGNAVPVKLAEYVARCILEYLGDRSNNMMYHLPKYQLKLF